MEVSYPTKLSGFRESCEKTACGEGVPHAVVQ